MYSVSLTQVSGVSLAVDRLEDSSIVRSIPKDEVEKMESFALLKLPRRNWDGF